MVNQANVQAPRIVGDRVVAPGAGGFSRRLFVVFHRFENVFGQLLIFLAPFSPRYLTPILPKIRWKRSLIYHYYYELDNNQHGDWAGRRYHYRAAMSPGLD